MRAPERKASTCGVSMDPLAGGKADATRRFKLIVIRACFGVAVGENVSEAFVELVFTCGSVGLSLQVLTQSLNKTRGLFPSYRVPLVPGSSKQLRGCTTCHPI